MVRGYGRGIFYVPSRLGLAGYGYRGYGADSGLTPLETDSVASAPAMPASNDAGYVRSVSESAVPTAEAVHTDTALPDDVKMLGPAGTMGPVTSMLTSPGGGAPGGKLLPLLLLGGLLWWALKSPHPEKVG